jgi:tripartite-type tricarboxylate transporter receptor subunit TctC
VLHARAETGGYPSKPIVVIIPFPAGGGTDLSFRALAGAMEPLLGQKFEVVNKPADGGVQGLWEIANAAPDGYTLGATFDGPLTASPHTRKLPYTLDSFTFIESTFESDYLLCVRKDFPAADGTELVSMLREKPLGYSYANDGKGSSGYFAAERLFDALGVVLRSESFNGSQGAAKGLLTGKTSLYIGIAQSVLPRLKSGEIRCPVTLGSEPPSYLPDAKAPAALGAPGKEAAHWRMILAPRGLPAERAAKLEAAIREGMASPAVQAYVAAQGERVAVRGAIETTTRVEREYAVNAEIADRLLLVSEQPAAPANISASTAQGAGEP